MKQRMARYEGEAAGIGGCPAPAQGERSGDIDEAGTVTGPHHPPLPHRLRLQVHRARQDPPPSTRPTSPSSSASQSRPTSRWRSRGSWTYTPMRCSSMPLSATAAPCRRGMI